jgi:alginate O-acetyltransferase complex protein AlgJ
MSKRRNCNLIVITIFALSVALPLFAMISGLDRTPLIRENRDRARFPSIASEKDTLKKFPHDFYAYFRDNFGFRDALIRLNFLIRRTLLKEAEFNEVLFGKGDWLFYLGEHEMDDALGITHYDVETLRMWADTLEQKRRWLAARGIRYLFVIAPNKETIYGEYLPYCFRRLHDKTGLDEFIDYMRAHSSVEVVDLRPALLAAKKTERLYWKTDTHWNDYGAYVAYRETAGLLSRWFPSRPVDTLADFVIVRKRENGGDLAVLAGGADFLKEEQIDLVPRKPVRARRIEAEGSGEKIISMEQDDASKPRAVVFRDSFFDAVIPFLSEQFQYVRYYRHHWDESIPIAEVVRICRPDIVIEEFAERRIKMDMGNLSRKDLP